MQDSKKIFFVVIFVAGLVCLATLLNLVFSGRIILPQSFNFGPLTIHFYGLTMAAAVLAGFSLAIRRASRYDISHSQADDLLFWLVIYGFLGARLYHVLTSIKYYWVNPLDILKVWNGGLSIYGAVLAGILVIIYFAKKHRLSWLRLLDWLTLPLLLGQIVGRFGNLFNYEVLGYPTNLPWKMFVPPQFRPENFLSAQYYHPFFLYELLGNAVIFIVLFLCLKPDHKHIAGRLFFFYLLLYNLFRFGLEFLRTDSNFIFGFRQNALVSLALAVVAGVWLIVQNRQTSDAKTT